MVHDAREFLSPRMRMRKCVCVCSNMTMRWKEMASLNVNYVVLNVSVAYILKAISLSIHACDSNVMGGGAY